MLIMTSATLRTDRIPTGIPRLDAMLGGAGYYRGSSVLITGTAGAGKSSIAAHFADAACRRGERVLYFAFEESPTEIMRNMRSIGMDLKIWVDKGLLQFHSARPAIYGLEQHLTMVRKAVLEFKPQAVIMDPVNSFGAEGSQSDVKGMLIRMIDFLKTNQITGLYTSLTSVRNAVEHTEISVSSLMDTWLLVHAIEIGGERNRGLAVLKSRGMAHSNQIREFLLTDQGVELRDVYVGASGVLTGSARLTQVAQDQAAQMIRDQEVELRRVELERKHTTLDAQISA